MKKAAIGVLCGALGIGMFSLVTSTAAQAVEVRTTPIAMLDSLPHVQRYTAGWTTSAFPGIGTKVGNCTIRQRALMSAAKGGKAKGCVMRGSSWKLDYTKKSTTVPAKASVSLLIPAIEVWRSGGWNWTNKQRNAYSRDVKNLRVHMVTTKQLYKARKNREPQGWMPKNAAMKCQYAIDWTAVKYRYQLAIDDVEANALNNAMANCNQAKQNLPGVKPNTALPSLDVPISTELIGRTIGWDMFGMNAKPIASMPTVGFGTMRLWDGYGWAAIEPQKDQYDWQRLDDAVAAGERVHARVMLTMALTPAWAATTPGNTEYETGSSPPKDVNDYYDYVDDVSKRYAGRIAAYQVWNEGNLETFWRGSIDQLADMTKRAYDIIKANDPNAIVVAPSTTIRLTGAFGEFYPKFLAALKARGWPIDVLSVHSYPPSIGKSKERDEGLALLRVITKNADATRFPVWETEINFGLAGPGPNYPDVDYTHEEQQTLLVRGYLDSLRNALANTDWFEWQEGENDLLGVQMYKGSAAVAAWNAMTDTLVGSVFNGCTDTQTTSTCNFTDSRGAYQVMWALTGSQSVTIGNGQTACRFAGACVNGPNVTLTDAPVVVR